jgi:poly(3-hydroxybutyrate) depolymerase
MLSVTRRARSAAAAGRRRVRSAAALFACTVAAVVYAGAPPAQADTPAPLQHYDITADYVSGLSSGAAEAVQFQVAYSATFKGLAFFGGAPYDCAQDSTILRNKVCMSAVLPGNLAQLYRTTDQWSSARLIDPTSDLAGKPVYEWHGTQDKVVGASVAAEAATFLRHYGADVTYVNNVPSGHGWITISPISRGGPVACGATKTPYLNNCGIDAEGAFLSMWLGSVNPPNGGTLTGQMIQFDQNLYSPGDKAAAVGLASDGYEYVPGSCAAGARCRLVLALHGCMQSTAEPPAGVDDAFIDDTYLNQYADTNDLVILYPQIAAATAANPKGCWDWWGYLANDANYAQKSSTQMSAVMKMIRASGG